MSIFGDETIPVPGTSPEDGHDEQAAVDTENDEGFEEEQDFDSNEQEQDDEDAGDVDSDSDADDAEEEHSEELLAGKYKTTADLVKGYKELERAFHQARNGGGQREQQQDQSPNNQQQPGQNQRSELTNVFWDRFKVEPLAAIEAVVSHMVNHQTAPIFEERRTSTLSSNLQTIAKEYRQAGTEEGLRQLLGKVQEIAEDAGNPDLIRNPSERILRMAAREAFGDTAAKAFAKGKEAGRVDSERARASKANAAVRAGGKGSKQQGEAKSPEQEIADAILAAGKGGGGIFG